MKTKEEIYRCPFCSKKPIIRALNIGDNRYIAECVTRNHDVAVYAKTRAGVIKRWNSGR